MLFPYIPITPNHQTPKKKRPFNICIVKSVLEASSIGQLSKAVSLLDLLVVKGIRLPSRILGHLLSKCAENKAFKEGKLVHLHLKLTGLKRPTTFLANNLICMYFRCGRHVEACKVFDRMEVRNLYSWNNMLSGFVKLGMIHHARRLFDRMVDRDCVSWNTMVIGYAQSGMFDEALEFYRQLRRLSIGYNEFSFAGVLTACVKLKGFGLCRQIHGQILVSGFPSNVVLCSSVLDAYAKCGKMEDARRLFDEIPQKDIFVWTTLVSGYANRGDMDSAVEIFDRMPLKNSISWTSLIGGYAKLGLGHEALKVFRKMIVDHVKPDQFTYSSCLSACSITASFKLGKQIHAHLIRNNIRVNNIVVSSIIDMYSKCGDMENAKIIFHVMGDKQDVVIWNTMIAALAHHGHGVEAIALVRELLRSAVKPNRITFVVILNACSHSGLVQEGIEFFNSMNRDHGVAPDEEHYACLIDLLGRAGQFNELIKHLQTMDCKPGDHVLNALLGVCRIRGNLNMGRETAEHLIKLDPKSPSAYVMLSSIYAALGKWELVEKIRLLMDERQVKKELAISWIEIENKVHAFTVSDTSHPLKETIYSVLGHLGNQMEDNVLLPKIPL